MRMQYDGNRGGNVSREVIHDPAQSIHTALRGSNTIRVGQGTVIKLFADSQVRRLELFMMSQALRRMLLVKISASIALTCRATTDQRTRWSHFQNPTDPWLLFCMSAKAWSISPTPSLSSSQVTKLSIF
jgi:hypothetical protein